MSSATPSAFLSILRCTSCSSRRSSLSSLRLTASSLAESYILRLPRFTPPRKDRSVNRTKEIIRAIMSTTYAPTFPIDGQRSDAKIPPSAPPPLLCSAAYWKDFVMPYSEESPATSSRNRQKNTTNTTPATIFSMAARFSRLDTKKAAPTKKQTGNRYAINPNIPKKNPLTFAPTKPPIPKLLINRTMQAASITKRATSLPKDTSGLPPAVPFLAPAPPLPSVFFPLAAFFGFDAI